jgi:enterochelin esterase-like enzyme
VRQVAGSAFLMIAFSLSAWESAAEVRVERGQLRLELETAIPGQKVHWVSNANDWDEARTPLVEARPGFYALTVPEPWVERLEYKFVVDGEWRTDPDNPERSPDGNGGWNSVLSLSFREDPLLEEGDSESLIERTFLFGSSARNSRRVTVIVPEDPLLAHRALTLYFQDGGDYLSRASVRNLLENLAKDPSFPPLAAVLIPPKDRMKEYGLTSATLDYAEFLSRTVIPFVERETGIGGSRRKRALIGPSLGGLVTVYLAIELRELFATAISQSGSFWYRNEILTRYLETAPLAGTRLFFTVGAFETPTMVRTNRRVAEVLQRRGDVAFEYREFPNAHDWLGWRNQLSFVFKTLFANPSPGGLTP